MVCGFIEHRSTPAYLKSKIIKSIENFINEGYDKFIIGMYSGFDRLAIASCLELKSHYKNIEINIVSAVPIKKKNFQGDFKLISYPIKEKSREKIILESYKHIINECELIISYINLNMNKSRAIQMHNYILKKNKKIINLFENEKIY